MLGIRASVSAAGGSTAGTAATGARDLRSSENRFDIHVRVGVRLNQRRGVGKFGIPLGS